MFGTVLDFIFILGLQQGFAGSALCNNAPFFLTPAILSANTRKPNGQRRCEQDRTHEPGIQSDSSALESSSAPATSDSPVTFVLQGIPQGFNAEIRLTYYVGNRRVTDTVWDNGVVTTTRWGRLGD